MNNTIKVRGIEVNDAEMYEYFQKKAGQVFYGIAGREEHVKERFQLTSEAIAGIYKSLQAIYSKEEAKEEVCLIENAFGILNYYIGIEGMDHLLVNNYAAIEKEIFLEHTASGTPKRIREHYKHQFRNAYLGLRLLKDFHLDQCIVDCIWDEGSEYARYIMASVSEELPDSGKDVGNTEEAEKMVREIVYKSYFVSALFHDIGYPLAYYFRMAEQIHQFTPFFRIVNPAVKTVFNEIRALLNNSWLFRTVDHKEIMEKYQKDDHGCLSAISFLMNFYFSGSIYSLTPKKRCIVEMAAVAIYKHTNRYDENNRMIFRLDPISYLLRICDDLQEWQRFLVVIGETHNYLKCSECGRIIVPDSKEKREYSCPCGKQFRKITQIQNKKLNYIDICNGLMLDSNKGNIEITLQYDCYRQLELLLSDYSTVVYRNKGLEELKCMLEHQKYLPKIELKYFLSNNPVELIGHMIEESKKSEHEIVAWANSLEEKEKEGMWAFLKEYRELIPDSELKYGKQIEKDAVKYARDARKFVKENMGQIFSLWEFLFDK